MRRLIVAAMVAASVQGAQAADLPDWGDLPVLRGAVGLGRGVGNFEGYYIGAQAGYGSTDMNFTGSNSAMTARMLANRVIENDMGVSQWPLFISPTSQHQTSFGGFAGYTGQWEDVTLGVDISYMHGKFIGSSSASQTLVSATTLTGGQYHAVSYASSKAMEITDLATFRGRAGYVFGNFMPYAFGGLAVARATSVGSVRVAEGYGATQADASLMLANGPVIDTASSIQAGRLIYGYTAGLGAEMNLFGNLFARAEWEYVRLTGQVDTSINTVRGGVGYRF
jgi:opacity protein-like surface antigen